MLPTAAAVPCRGVASVFGNEVDPFYSKLLEGVSGVDFITRFDASDFPTKFAAQVCSFVCVFGGRPAGGHDASSCCRCR